MLIGSANDQIIRSFFAVGSEHEEGSISFFAEGFDLISALKRVNIMFSGKHGAVLPA